MKYIVFIAVLMLTGCTIAPTIQASNARSVLIRATYTDEAMALADTECAKNNRKALFVSETFVRAKDFAFHYDCVD